jgi:transposase
VSADLDLSKLSHAEKDALILTLLARLDEAHKLIAELQARIDDLTRPGKTPNNSSVPPSKGHKPNRPDKAKREGPRKGSLGRKGGGRALTAEPDEVVLAKPSRCHYCQHAFVDADQRLDTRYDKIDLPRVRPTVTRVERYAAECPCCGATTLAPVPEGLEPGTPFSVNIVALAMYLRFVHAVSYKRLTRLLMELFGLAISEGALNAAFRRGKPRFDANVAAILARLRRARVIYSDETGVRIDGRGHWNWVFQNADVVIHVVRRSRGADVVAEVLAGHRPMLWVSDLYGAQQGHADRWQVCLAHQLRDCQYAIEAGDAVFAPRMKALLLRAVVLARRHRDLADSTRREYRRRLECSLDAVMALAPITRDGQRLRKRYARVRDHLFTFLDHPEIAADNNSSERELRPTATYRKVTGGFRSDWGADLFAAVRSVIGTAARRGIDAYQIIRETLRGQSTLAPG